MDDKQPWVSAHEEPALKVSGTRSPLLSAIVHLLSLALILLAFGLYTFRLDAQSLWYDEAVSARLASMSLPDLVRWTANDIQPPLYYVLLHAWTRAAGMSEWALRFFSAWWGVLLVALGYALARRMGRARGMGVVAALLFLLAPWNLYYSQEARMYTMLLALGVGTALVVVRAGRARAQGVKFGLLGLALLYTHYFSLFLLLAFSLWLALRLYKEGRHRRRLGATLTLAWAIMLVGYLPWLPFLLRRLREDASYWGGTLKVGEALRHWWVHMSLGAPETFLEQDAVRWLPVFLALTVLAIVYARVFATSASRFLAFQLIWLLVPPLFILLLAYRSPKFNPRYLMIAYPAWLLLLASVWPVFRAARSPTGWKRLVHWAARAVGCVLPLLLLPFFLAADRAWFTDPAFTKPDFRGAIAYIREHRTVDEPVLLVSGHMSPVMDYYAADIPYARLPDVDVLDVRQVLGFEVARDMNAAIAGKRGVWLLLWQDEVVDPMGVVPFLLQQVGEEDPDVPDAFWHVRVRHFRLPPGARVPESPPIARPLRVNWANQVELLGYSQYGDVLALFFRARENITDDLRIHLEVRDRDGFLWGQTDTRPGPYLYPTFRWPTGKVVLGQHTLPIIPGTPAGTYVVRVRLYSAENPAGLDILDEAGNPQGKEVLLTDVVLPTTRPLVVSDGDKVLPPFPPVPAPVEAGQIVTFTTAISRASDLFWLEAARVWPAPPWEPGERVYAQLRWRAPRPPMPDDTFTLFLMDEAPQWPLVSRPLAAFSTPEASWPITSRFFSQVRFRVPRNIQPGEWTLVVQLRYGSSDIVMGQMLATIQVEPSQRRFDVPQVTYPVNAIFGGAIRLVGVDVQPLKMTPGATVPITLTWQSRREVEESYTAFVHILGPDGRVIAQEDHIPCRGACPTDGWIAGEVVQDRYDLTLPPDAPSQGLVLEIGLYNAQEPGYPRLWITEGPFSGQNAVRLDVK